MMLAPSDIYYSQDSISNRFGKNTEQAGVLIGETLDKILTGECNIYDIKTIKVMRRRGRYLTADNRRLWIFKRLEELGECKKIPTHITYCLNSQKSVTDSTIEVEGNPGGHLWRTWNDRQASFTEQNFESSESDYQLLPMRFPWMILSPKETRRCLPSKMYYSKSHIRCNLPKLEKDINQICTGQFPFTNVEMKVYQYDDKYCALDNEKLWKLRVAEKFKKCSAIKINIITMPNGTSYPYFSDELNIETKPSRIFYDFCKTIRELPTLETIHIHSSSICYSVSCLSDSYNGKSIIAALVDFRKNPEAVLVVKNGRELYALDNQKLWILKKISKIERRPLEITVHIKMEMDFNMLRYFSPNFTSPHFTTVEFKEVYHHSPMEKTLFDLLRREEEEEEEEAAAEATSAATEEEDEEEDEEEEDA